MMSDDTKLLFLKLLNVTLTDNISVNFSQKANSL